MADLMDTGRWQATWKVTKFAEDGTFLGFRTASGNLLMNGGVSNLWECLIGNGGASSLQYFSHAHAYLGVGDSTTASAATQTDLQAATNKLRVAQDMSFPTHTDGTTSASQVITFESTFTTTQANFPWNEVACFNDSAAGRMLNRKVVNLGTKVLGQQWVLTLTITIS